MGALILPSRFTQQPQQPSLGSRGGLLAGAQAVIVGGVPVNLASGRPLVTAGTGIAQRPTAGGVAESFRKNFYRKTEALAIGTASFVDIWSGIPVAYGAAGLATDAGFLTGSSNNLTGIAANGRGGVATWGAVYNWPTFNDSLEVLPLGIVTTIIAARYQDRMDLWRDGKLVKSFTQAPMNYGTTPMIIGGFLEDTAYWTSSSDTTLAARVLGEWSAADLRSVSTNPWQLFAAPPRRIWVATSGAVNTTVNPAAGALALAGYAPTISQPKTVAPGVGALSITGYAPVVTQGATTSIAPATGALTLSGYAPGVAQSANQLVTPGAGAVAIFGYALALAQTANQSITAAAGSMAIVGYAPAVAQALASPIMTPGAGTLSIMGYAPIVEQTAPITKIGGDDAPRSDDEERIEIWEPRQPTKKRDDSLDKVVREAYAKATGKPISEAIAKPGPSVRAQAPIADTFDYDEDDFEVLLLSY